MSSTLRLLRDEGPTPLLVGKGIRVTEQRMAMLRELATMPRWWEFLRRARAPLCVILTLIPLLLSGHHHSTPDEGTPDSCALCVVGHHMPATQSPVQVSVAPILHLAPTPERCVSPPAQHVRPFVRGRAPPHGSRLA